MLSLRSSKERGHAQHGWLDSHHTFSFADYYDPKHMGFRALRVINEDRVEPGRGFGTHPHRDMEIVSYVLDGALQHKDSMGTGSIIAPGDVQRMTAGTGVLHSEFNASKSELVHFLQIWIVPEKPGLTPGYEQKRFEPEDKRGKLRLIASRDAREGSITIHQDVAMYASLLDPGDKVSHALAEGRYAWIQVTSGAVLVNEKRLEAGDGVAISDERSITIASAAAGSELLLFDLG
jgi:quercetin 2,3-dioxygenase